MEMSEEFEELSRMLDAVIEAGPRLDSEVREKLVEWEGGDVGQALFDILLDVRLRREAVRGETHAIQHAAELLVRRGEEKWVAEMARLLPDFEGISHTRERILAALCGVNTGQMGDACVEGLWDVYEEMREAGEAEPMSALADILYEHCGATDRVGEAYAESAL